MLWFDGDWERDAEQWRFGELKELLQEWAPGVIVNSRMGKHGDYGTPEQAIPIASPAGAWEFCVTLNDHWGYMRGDDNHKSARQCIQMLVECAQMGGNLLLDIGPKNDGSMQPEQVGVLEKIGRWTHQYSEAIFGTTRGLPHGHFYGASTLSPDQTILYLFLFDIPRGEIAVKGLRNLVQRATVMGHEGELSHRVLGGAPWAHLPGITWIDMAGAPLDDDVTVIKLELDGPLDLYTGAGDVITAN